MKKFKWLLGILLLALVPMLQSCDDDGYSIGDFSWDWATVRATGGGGYYLEGDNWGVIDPVATSIPWFKPVDGERVVAFFNPLYDMEGGKGVQVKMEGIQELLTKEVEDMSTEEEPEKVTVNVAYMPDYASLNGLISAIELGYFDDENIDVQLTEFSDGPTIIQAMESGSIDVGYIGQGAHKLCINGKADIFALAHVSNGDAVIGSKEKGTDTIEGLKGKTIAYSSGTSSEDILTKTLEKGGMTMDDITAMDMDATNIVTAMLSGSVDACATWVPNSLKVLEELGDDGVQLTDNKTFIDDTVSLASWIAMPKYAEENRDVLVRFARALYKGFDYRADHSHDDEVCGWIADKIKLEKNSLLDQVEVADWTTSEFIRDHMDDVKGYYELQQKSFVESGDCEETPVDNYVLFDVMEEACAE